MTYRIGWLSPFTGASGVGTFSRAVTANFPRAYRGEAIDLTILHPAHSQLYRSPHRRIQIEDIANFHQIMPLFDLLIYNIGNNCEHHELIFKLLSMYPGLIICHDYVFQHYLARRSMDSCNNFSSYGALLTKYGDAAAPAYIKRSRITSRTGGILYSPWDSEYSVTQPLSEILLGLGSALVLHSAFAYRHAKASFAGPVTELGMPYDQKRIADDEGIAQWGQGLRFKRNFRLVSFGHIQTTKCIDQVLGAISASEILRRKIRYTIAGFAGDPIYLSELQAMVDALSLRDIVTFETDVSEARLDHLMQEADIFINLRRPNTEGSSASLVEQLEMGKPVIVLDSGSYSEIPADAAVKLPADADANDLKNAMERLVTNPDTLRAIGKAGQGHARTWSCMSYADHLLRFAFENRDLLHARARIVSLKKGPVEAEIDAPEAGDALWRASLARARRSLRYLDKNMLALDPEIIMGMPHDSICTYAAQVIFGIFNKPGLDQALHQFFTARRGAGVYWACVKFMLIADAVFNENDDARQRLLAMPACFDLDLWAVIEQLPAAQFWAAAQLLLRQGVVRPKPGSADDDIARGHTNRLAILDLVELVSQHTGDDIEQLKRWLEEPPEAEFGQALSVIERDLGVEIGSAGFRDFAVLWGFHKMESDHAWMQGRRGFVGLKLAKNVTKIALLVKHVDANADNPCKIGLSDGTSHTEIELQDSEPHWLTIRITDNILNKTMSWLRITTSRASMPPESADTRILSCCILRLEVTARIARQRVDFEKILARSSA